MCGSCDWESLVDEIDDLLDDERYGFAVETLEGIRDWCVDNQHCTEAQAEAVDNIRDSVPE